MEQGPDRRATAARFTRPETPPAPAGGKTGPVGVDCVAGTVWQSGTTSDTSKGGRGLTNVAGTTGG